MKALDRYGLGEDYATLGSRNEDALTRCSASVREAALNTRDWHHLISRFSLLQLHEVSELALRCGAAGALVHGQTGFARRLCLLCLGVP